MRHYSCRLVAPGWAQLCSQIKAEPYNPKRPENVNITLYRCTGRFLGPPHDKTNKMSVRQAKTEISLGIRPVWSESSLCAQSVAKDSLCAQSVAKDQRFFHVDGEDSDQAGRMPRLIWVFAGRTVTLLVRSCRGSYCICFTTPTDHSHAKPRPIPKVLKKSFWFSIRGVQNAHKANYFLWQILM